MSGTECPLMTPGSCGKARVATLGSLQIETARGIVEKEPGPVLSEGRSGARLDVGLDRIDLAEARVRRGRGLKRNAVLALALPIHRDSSGFQRVMGNRRRVLDLS